MKQQSIYSRRWNKKNPEKVKATAKKYNDRHLAENVDAHRKWRRKNIVSFLLSLARYRAKKKGLPFSITDTDVCIPKICPVLGIPLERGTGNPTNCSPSIDRIKPCLGYVPGNVRVISHRANSLKGNGTLEEFEKIVIYLKTVTG